MVELEFQYKTKELIDSLKNICAHYGLGNDGNEFKIITQTFLYKFLNDKFAYEAKKIDEKVAGVDKWEEALLAMSEDELEMLRQEGFVRVMINGQLRNLEEEIVLDKKKKHDISICFYLKHHYKSIFRSKTLSNNT